MGAMFLFFIDHLCPASLRSRKLVVPIEDDHWNHERFSRITTPCHAPAKYNSIFLSGSCHAMPSQIKMPRWLLVIICSLMLSNHYLLFWVQDKCIRSTLNSLEMRLSKDYSCLATTTKSNLLTTWHLSPAIYSPMLFNITSLLLFTNSEATNLFSFKLWLLIVAFLLLWHRSCHFVTCQIRALRYPVCTFPKITCIPMLPISALDYLLPMPT